MYDSAEFIIKTINVFFKLLPEGKEFHTPASPHFVHNWRKEFLNTSAGWLALKAFDSHIIMSHITKRVNEHLMSYDKTSTT